MDKPTFPIHPNSREELPRGPQSVPLWVVEAHAPQARINHGQTVARLKERQGLSWCELHAVLSDRLWQRMAQSDAMVECVSMIRRVDPVWYENWRQFCSDRQAAEMKDKSHFDRA